MEHISMSRKVRKQLIVFEKLKNKEITLQEAAERLKVTKRWVRTKFKRYIAESRSSKSSICFSPDKVELLVRAEYICQ
jgi:predicted ArsR family transcriptional regulator